MGRKRIKGKARKEAKAKAREEADKGGNNDQVPNSSEQSLLSALMRQLQIKGGKCWHAIIPASPENFSSEFVCAFDSAFREAIGSGVQNLEKCFMTAQVATLNEYAEVWNDSDNMEIANSLFLNSGTEAILGGDFIYAQILATFVRYFEQYIAVLFKQTQAVVKWSKIFETSNADEHTLVKFYRHRISCSCLDEKYEEVKHITKVGYCFNARCPTPQEEVERSNTKYCSRCRCVTYCSRECQVADWTEHKPNCDNNVAMIAQFEAKKGREVSVSIA